MNERIVGGMVRGGIVYKDIVVHIQDRGGRLVLTQAGLQLPCERGRFLTLGE
jgi:hypothetical protein